MSMQSVFTFIPRHMLYCLENSHGLFHLLMLDHWHKCGRIFSRSKEEAFRSTVDRISSKLMTNTNPSVNIDLCSSSGSPLQFAEHTNDYCLQTGHTLMVNEAVFRIVRCNAHVKRFNVSCSIIAGVPFLPKIKLDLVHTPGDPESESMDYEVDFYLSDSYPAVRDLNDVIGHGYNNADLRDIFLNRFGWNLIPNRVKSHIHLPNDTVGKYCIVHLRLTDRSRPDLDFLSYLGVSSPIVANPGYLFDERHRLIADADAKKSSSMYRFCSYNVLADLYVKPGPKGYFPYCAENYVRKRHRYPVILHELEGYKFDLACLQEVDVGFAEMWLREYFSQLSYDISFARKGGNVNEGCAILYSTNRFRRIKTESFLMSDLLQQELNADILKCLDDIPQTKDMLLKLNNIFQISALRVIDSTTIILVGNTHLYFHPKWAHLKVIQFALGIREMEHFRTVMSTEYPDAKIRVAVFGDMNSLPGSGVYNFATDGIFSHDHSEWATDDDTTRTGMDLKHDLGLSSACGTPEFTNFIDSFQGCLDYIFVDGTFSVKNVYPFPSREQLREFTAIPSQRCPSDHLALLCDVEIMPM